jgi:ADP-dependent NAD(P)H-hydrate dehydratase / NAD(P)H-hydrate epimerase
MIPVLTVSQMREVDRHAIEDAGIPGRALMEHAGRALAERAHELTNGSVAVVCGAGNNGGDGYVAARFLSHWGVETTTYMTRAPSLLSGDAAAAYDSLVRTGSTPVVLEADAAGLTDALRSAGVIVDCLLGIGSSGAPRAPMAQVIDAMNDSGAAILACDVPSGVDANTGATVGACVHAAETLTIGYPKPGLLLGAGADCTGRLRIADIGFPRARALELGPHAYVLEREDAVALLPSRPRAAHKGTFGRALIIAGSVGMTGAAGLAVEAALRAGAGTATLATAASARATIAASVPEATTHPLAETGSGAIAAAAEDDVRRLASGCNALAVGPGLGQDAETADFVRSLVDSFDGLPPGVVFDADALNALSPLAQRDIRLPAGCVITPHPGEMARLLGCTVADVEADRIGVARNLATSHAITVVLKGAPTVIGAPDGTAYLNPTGNPGMATGGSGDVLTGLLAGLVAQGLAPTDAAVLGVYAHGLAGDVAAKEFGRGLVAGDILRAIPTALMQLERHQQDGAA